MKVILRRAAVAIGAVFTTSTMLLLAIAIAPAQASTLTSQGRSSALTTQAPALTSAYCFETLDQSFWCLNNWEQWFGDFSDGTGSVKMEGFSSSNENFEEEQFQSVSRCGGYTYVTHDCPFTNTAFDQQYAGLPIVQIANLASVPKPNTCVATDGKGQATLGYCNGSDGATGGSTGTLFVDHDGYMINVYWTNAGAGGTSATCMWGLAANGATVTLKQPTGNGCETWSEVES
jgi:hypothetical protein